MTQGYHPQKDDILVKNILPSIYGVKLGRDAACKEIWDKLRKKVRVSNIGPAVPLEEILRAIFEVAE